MQTDARHPAGLSRFSGEYGVTVASVEDVALPHPTVQERSHLAAAEGETSMPAESITRAIPIMIFPRSINITPLRNFAWVGDTPKYTRVSPDTTLWLNRR
jgi:hypothetical protein